MGTWVCFACRSGRVAVKMHVCFQLYIIALGIPGTRFTNGYLCSIINGKLLKMMFEADAPEYRGGLEDNLVQKGLLK